MRLAVTGGSGLIGAALVRQVLGPDPAYPAYKDWSVKALMRNPQKAQAFSDNDRFETVLGDLADQTALKALVAGCDCVIHLAGVTHARAREDFMRINIDGAGNVAKTAAAAGVSMVHISSLSARMPSLSSYAGSKFASEDAVRQASGDNAWRALRLPAIYGPGDMATLPYFRLIKSGFALEPRTHEPARASLLHVDDAAKAILASIHAPPGSVYDVGDDAREGRSWHEIGQVLAAQFGRTARRIRVPKPLIASFHSVTRAVEATFSRPASVREGQVNEFFHPDWVARDNLLCHVVDWRARTPLAEGFANTILWYQKERLL